MREFFREAGLKKNSSILFLLLLCFLVAAQPSCDLTTGLPEATSFDLFTQLKKFSISQNYYDSMTVQNAPNLTLQNRDFQRISVALLGGGSYSEVASCVPQYSGQNENLSMTYTCAFKFDSSQSILRLQIRYWYEEKAFYSFDTVMQTCKYPYSSAELVLDARNLTLPNYADYLFYFQDFDRIGTKYYFHPTGPLGLYEYDPLQQNVRNLIDYMGGDHIAADSTYVFVDWGHIEVLRYNLLRDTVELLIPSSLLGTTEMAGLEAYKGYLYVAIWRWPKPVLKRFTFGGIPLDSVFIALDGYAISICDDVVYGIKNWEITRFDLKTGSSLPPLLGPSRDPEGITIRDGVLYFADFGKRIIGKVPVADLKIME